MEAAVHDDHVRRRDAAIVSVQAGDLQRRLIGLGAGVAEEHVVHAGEFRQARCQPLLRADVVEIRGMQKGPGLFLQRLCHRRVGVAKATDGDSGEAVEVGLAGLVEHVAALAPHERHGQAPVGWHDGRHRIPFPYPPAETKPGSDERLPGKTINHSTLACVL